jgi:hypothetical protein
MTKGKRTNNDITQKTKERATGTLPKPRGEHMCFTRVSSSCSIYGTCRVTLASNPVISHEQQT